LRGGAPTIPAGRIVAPLRSVNGRLCARLRFRAGIGRIRAWRAGILLDRIRGAVWLVCRLRGRAAGRGGEWNDRSEAGGPHLVCAWCFDRLRSYHYRPLG